ncbi:OmpA family protein [Aquimarina agarivorans]|uniref:OmpA family protein n=1 Tax=Aquimarina agarivorans TaxID=980584 RepID=UPI000248F28F|nr:OmpA family protein [Aquimarina agarivorans]
MKKKLLIICFFASFNFINAQNIEYNKWSIELDAGALKTFSLASPGHFTKVPEFIAGNFGIRYALNTKFGIKADFGYLDINNDDNSIEFETIYYRGSIQGVINLGNIMGFRTTAFKNIGLLFHGGGGLSFFDYNTEGNTDDELAVNFILGLTPQLKLSKRVTFHTDLSYSRHLGQNFNWDGAENVTDFGSLLTATAGFTIHLGKHENHADWTIEDGASSKQLEELSNKIANIEADLIDTDQDGVADYLDREPNTTSGVTVNTKGVTIDNNRNGIPDEFETALDRKYANDTPTAVTTAPEVSYDEAIKKLLSEGYVNVYFNTASATPSIYSLDAINYLIEYMKEHPNAQAELIGFADQRGSDAFNSSLSSRRAKKVYDILIESGIAPERLLHTGNGETASGSSKESLQLRRKVTFKLK